MHFDCGVATCAEQLAQGLRAGMAELPAIAKVAAVLFAYAWPRDNDNQPADDEQDDDEVQNEDRVGKELVGHNVELANDGRCMM